MKNFPTHCAKQQMIKFAISSILNQLEKGVEGEAFPLCPNACVKFIPANDFDTFNTLIMPDSQVNNIHCNAYFFFSFLCSHC